METVNLTEHVTTTKRIYEGRVINLRVDTVTLPNGKTSTREIVEHRGAVAMVPVLSNGDIVLVKQYRHAASGILLEIPAGSLNENEDAIASAHRELAEEIKYSARRMIPLFSIFMAPGYTTEKIHIYAALDLEPCPGTLDEDEFLEIVSMPLAKAVEAIRTGEIDDAKSVSAILYYSANLERLSDMKIDYTPRKGSV